MTHRRHKHAPTASRAASSDKPLLSRRTVGLLVGIVVVLLYVLASSGG